MFSAYGSVFRDALCSVSDCGFAVVDGARASLTDCHVSGHIAGTCTAVANVRTGGTISFLRTTIRDNRAHDYAGCFQVEALGTLTIDDCDIEGCWTSDGHSGMLYLYEGALLLEVV